MAFQSRRTFLQVATLAAAGAACGRTRPRTSPTETASASPTASATTPSRTVRSLAWRPIAAKGPGPRRDHSFVGSTDGRTALLFGGRSKGTPTNELWIYDVTARRWSKGPGGPSARFGASAIFAGDRLLVFGGQGGPSEFFNDVWEYRLSARAWARVATSGPAPAPRYGAGGANVSSALLMTHGFTNTGRFDDTWALSGSGWRARKAASPPVKRCLHRFTYVPALRKAVLFGGQTDGTPFLGDTWLFDPVSARWERSGGAAPPARTLYAASATQDRLYVFGGNSDPGPVNDLWSFDGSSWRKESPTGSAPPARGGIEGAFAGSSMLVFGGGDDAGEKDDLWELTLPA